MAENSGLQKILETELFIYFAVCLGGLLCDAMCYGICAMYMLISIRMYICACTRACVCVCVYVRRKHKEFFLNHSLRLCFDSLSLNLKLIHSSRLAGQ